MTTYREIKNEVARTYLGKREKVVSARITPKLRDKVEKTMAAYDYQTMNDFIEDALVEKIAIIEWTKAKKGVKYGS